MNWRWIQIDETILYSFLAIFAFLTLASVIYILSLKEGRDLNSVGLRIKTWWIMVAIMFVALATNLTTALIFFGLVSFLGLKEFLSLMPTRRADRLIIGVAYLLIPLQYIWVYTQWYGMYIIFIPVYAFLFLPMLMVMSGETEGFLRAVSTLQWAVMTSVFCISHAAYLLVLPESINPGVGGIGLVLFLLVVTQINDVAQFLWGKMIGGPKIVPKVSPNKTVAGFLGGLFTTAGLSYLIAPYLTPLTQIESLWLGALMAVAGFIGDVTMSAIKRDIRVKDSGNILPGHGGILDRIDSLTFTAPLFFHLIFWLYY